MASILKKNLFPISPVFSESWFLFFLCLCYVRFFWGALGIYELDRFDEIFYIKAGIAGIHAPTWSPLYSLYFRFLGLFSTDILHLYFFNFFLLSFLPVLLCYLLLRRLKLGQEVSFIAALLVLISWLNLPIVPKVNQFSAVFLLSCWFVGTFFRNEIYASFFMLVAAAISIYIRQDNLFVWLLLFFFFVYRAFCTQKRMDAFLICLQALKWSLLFFAAGWVIMGNPLGGNRPWLAFRDHYLFVAGQHLGATSFGWFAGIFPGAENIGQIFWVNPAAFLAHVLNNLSRLFLAVYPAILCLCGFYFWPKMAPFFFPGKKSNFEGNKKIGEIERSFLQLVPAFLGKTLFCVLFLSVSPRYYLEFIFIFLVFYIWALDRAGAIYFFRRRALWLGPALLLLCPSSAVYVSGDYFGIKRAEASQEKTPILHLVQSVRQLQLREYIGCFSLGPFPAAMGANFHCLDFEIPLGYSHNSAKEFFVRKKIGMIIADDITRSAVKNGYVYDFLGDFENNYKAFGFSKSKIHQNPFTLYISTQTLLNAQKNMAEWE